MIVRTPDTARKHDDGVTCAAPIEWFDIGPTIVELTGGNLNYRQFAMSLLPLIENPDGKLRDDVVSELDGEVMIMNKHWKMAVNKEGLPYLLFDRADDPEEADNLVSVKKWEAAKSELQIRMLRRIVSTPMFSATALPPLRWT